MAKAAAWPLELFTRAVARNYSISGVLCELGVGVSGWNYRRVHRPIAQHGLDTSYRLGQAHLRGAHHSWTRSASLSDILVEHSYAQLRSYANAASLKTRLIRAGLLRDACYVCGITEWLGRRLVLQLDHMNGCGRRPPPDQPAPPVSELPFTDGHVLRAQRGAGPQATATA